MPRYSFRCDGCGAASVRWRPVAQRDAVEVCPDCTSGKDIGLVRRVFTPSANICVPAHFKIDADWCLPDREDAAGWEARQNSSQSHAPQTEDFGQFFERTVKSFD